ncbi:hypothetical protein HPB49_007876 [Dermacentor silvarum]|uniref:Uncharacterized protein n=1 Tax=Dermacentor silvarum TaxID=543639 RepID=A0ACB8D3X0_DERSI|nr:hypothetical protein HPB49_007876 [Dermacentor silvarum]
MLGGSQSAVLTFFGSVLPRYIYYRAGEKECIPFGNTVQFCRTCGKVGHRTDACPQPDLSTCRTCGVRNPEVTHKCIPTCAICSGDHATGDRSCPKRLKPVRYQAAKPPKKPHKLAHRWFSSEEEQSEWEYGRGATCSSRSRTLSPSNNRTHPGKPEQQRRRSTSRPRPTIEENRKANAHPRNKSPRISMARGTPQANQVS